MKRQLLAIFFLFSYVFISFGQSNSYILKRQKYKTSLSSINISPDGSVLLASFQDGSFRLLDPVSFQTRLEMEELSGDPIFEPKRVG